MGVAPGAGTEFFPQFRVIFLFLCKLASRAHQGILCYFTAVMKSKCYSTAVMKSKS